MRKLMLISAAALTTCFATSSVAAAKVEIEWQEPESYADVRPSNESRKRFRERTFKILEKYINKLAEDLPEKHTLSMTVTDLDLAGMVWPVTFIGAGVGANEVRLVRRVDIPRITFSYTLTDGDGTEVQQGDVKLKDMAFQDRFNPIFNSQALRYEKNMLREWFVDEFPQLVAKQ